MSKELEKKISNLYDEVRKKEQLFIDNLIKTMSSHRCEYCGCPNGIHKADCRFMARL